MPKQTAIVAKNIADKKVLLLKALEKSMGVVTAGCFKAGISRAQYYEYINTDEAFAQAVLDLQNVALDFAETALFANIANGREASTIFYLKTKGKHRGYVEKMQLDVSNTNYVANEMSKLDNLSIDELRQLGELTTKLVGTGQDSQA